jgi:hypothetical protein
MLSIPDVSQWDLDTFPSMTSKGKQRVMQASEMLAQALKQMDGLLAGQLVHSLFSISGVTPLSRYEAPSPGRPHISEARCNFFFFQLLFRRELEKKIIFMVLLLLSIASVVHHPYIHWTIMKMKCYVSACIDLHLHKSHTT